MDETIRFPCPACVKVLKAPANLAGKQAKCQKCGHTFRIPLLTLRQEPAPEEPTHVSQQVTPPAAKPMASLPLAYGITLGSFVVLIGGWFIASRFNSEHILDGAGLWVPMILYTITYVAGLSVWAAAKGRSPAIGFLCGLFLGPAGALVLLLLENRKKTETRRGEHRWGGGIEIPLGTAGLILVLTRLLLLVAAGLAAAGFRDHEFLLGIIIGIAVLAPHVGLVVSIFGIFRNSGRVAGICGVIAWLVFTFLFMPMR